MLNDLFDLTSTLINQNIEIPPFHESVLESGRRDLIVNLREDGSPSSLRFLTGVGIPEFWTYGTGNQNRFPAVNIKVPLLSAEQSKLIDENKWRSRSASLAELRSLIQSLDLEDINPAYKSLKKSPFMLPKKSLTELQVFLDGESADIEPFKRLLNRFPQDVESAERLARSLAKRVAEDAKSADKTTLDVLKKILVGPKKGENLSGFYFDIDDGDLSFKVADNNTRGAVIKALYEKEGKGPITGTDIVQSALSDTVGVQVTGSFPQPKINIFGQTYLFSNNEDIDCLFRYGLKGGKSFPVTRDEARHMASALVFLAGSACGRNTTWSVLRSGKKEDRRLVVAWLEDSPVTNAKLAPLFCEVDDDEDDNREANYEDLCSSALNYLKGVCKADPSVLVHLWQFRAFDKGRKQLVYSDAFTADQLRSGCVTWLEAAYDAPDILFPESMKKPTGKGRDSDGRTAHAEGASDLGCPSPEALFSLARMQYRRPGGGDSRATPSFSRILDSGSAAFQPHQIYRLMFPKDQKEARGFHEGMLETTLRLSGDLLCEAGAYRTLFRNEGSCQSPRPAHPFSQGELQMASTAAAMLAILLYKLGNRKEHYVKNQAYNMGCLLREADELHRQYCHEVRNNSDWSKPLPAQLMGNSVFQIVAERPAEGLSRLEEKLRIYLGWAETSKSSKAEKIMRRLSRIATRIAAPGEVPERFSVQERAQLLLGYLAGEADPREEPQSANDEAPASKEFLNEKNGQDQEEEELA